jgi:uncharacterized membrane-anchored protein
VTRRALFWALVGIQAVIPVGMLGLREAHYSGADRVLLQVEPVDPLDPLRGEYVALRYPISTLQGPAGTVYVPLYPTGGDTWSGYLARTTKPDGGTFIRGDSTGSGQIAYGIEHAYVQEGTGRQYEQAALQHRLYAEVRIADDGRAALDHLVIR